MADAKGQPTATSEGERIAKAIARAGVCSRRDAEALIAEGRVKLNGKTVESPAIDVHVKDRIEVDGEPLPERQAPRLWRYHKPKGRVTTHKDPEGRPTVFEALPEELPRVLSIGRLDFNTEGLLLLTNDGELARHLELPSTGWARRYRVRAFGNIDQAALDALAGGVEIDGVRYGPIEASVEREQGDNVWVSLTIREGKNREVRRIMEHLGLTVNRLIRVSFGPFMLGDLETGQVEEVKTRVLQEQLGPRLTRQLGVKREPQREERALAAKRGKPTYLRRKTEEPARPVREFEPRPTRERRILPWSPDSGEEVRVETVEVRAPRRPGFGRDRGDRNADGGESFRRTRERDSSSGPARLNGERSRRTGERDTGEKPQRRFDRAEDGGAFRRRDRDGDREPRQDREKVFRDRPRDGNRGGRFADNRAREGRTSDGDRERKAFARRERGPANERADREQRPRKPFARRGDGAPSDRGSPQNRDDRPRQPRPEWRKDERASADRPRPARFQARDGDERRPSQFRARDGERPKRAFTPGDGVSGEARPPRPPRDGRAGKQAFSRDGGRRDRGEEGERKPFRERRHDDSSRPPRVPRSEARPDWQRRDGASGAGGRKPFVRGDGPRPERNGRDRDGGGGKPPGGFKRGPKRDNASAGQSGNGGPRPAFKASRPRTGPRSYTPRAPKSSDGE
jgi:23S rRNA pseudouridine2605 synthase